MGHKDLLVTHTLRPRSAALPGNTVRVASPARAG
jgi:hypothetical protein